MHARILMYSRGAIHRGLLLFITMLIAGGCAAGAAREEPAARPPVYLDAGDVDALATLLRLEDRREFDASTLGVIARSGTPEVRRRAALAIGRLRDPGGVSLLAPLLADPDTAVAATAAFALGLISDTAAVPALIPLITTDAPPTVAGEAAAALGKLRTAPGRTALVSLLENTPIEGADERVIGPALLAIWKFPRGEGPGPIIRWTRSGDPDLRWRAAYALVRRPDPAATRTLAGMADDPDPAVRAIAIRGLTAPLADTSGVGAEAVLPLLLRAARDEAYRVRINAARSLGTFADPPSVQLLAELLDSSDAHLAWTAAESLGRLGPGARTAAPALRRMASDTAQADALRAAGLLALVEIMPEEAETLAARLADDASWRIRAAAARAYARLGPPARAELLALVRDADSRVGAAALGAAVEAAGDSVAPLRLMLFESLGAPGVMVRAAALHGLAMLADPASLPLVLDAYDRALADARNDAALAAIGAIAALDEVGVPASRTFARRFGRPDDYLVRQRAAERLGDAVGSWGDPLPIDTGLNEVGYRSIVRQWILPALAGADAPRVRIETEADTIDVELFAADAPLTVRNFLRLAGRGYFDGQQWPRVVPNFVIQGGDPRGDTSGGPGWAIRDEINRHRYGRGTLGMALAGPDTGGSQFFITHSPQPHLDGGYTVFGQVISGLEVAEHVRPGDTINRIYKSPPLPGP